MGVSDRMATDGVLYEGWGAKGMHNLNRTVTLQEAAESLEVSRYDAVLMVSARAKENAYRDSEERPGGYIGNSFGGPLGSGIQKAVEAKSQVVSAVEELVDEYEVSGELPELITPGLPEDILAEMEAEDATGAQDAADISTPSGIGARSKAGAAAMAEELGIEAEGLGLLTADDTESRVAPATPRPFGRDGARAEVEDEAEEAEEDDDETDDLLGGLSKALLDGEGDDSFEDAIVLDGDGDDDTDGAADGELSLGNEDGDEDELFEETADENDLLDLFGDVRPLENSVEASGMSPGDA